jgi:hypothetical protein
MTFINDPAIWLKDFPAGPGVMVSVMDEFGLRMVRLSSGNDY